MMRVAMKVAFLLAAGFLFAVLWVKFKHPEINTMILGPFGIKASALRDAAGIGTCLLLGAAGLGIALTFEKGDPNDEGSDPFGTVEEQKERLAFGLVGVVFLAIGLTWLGNGF